MKLHVYENCNTQKYACNLLKNVIIKYACHLLNRLKNLVKLNMLSPYLN